MHKKMTPTLSPALALFDPSLGTTVSADASSFGFGAVFRSQEAIAYPSRAMTPTEFRYAQIEKEAVALTWLARSFVITWLA